MPNAFRCKRTGCQQQTRPFRKTSSPTEGHPSSMLHLSIPTECSDQNRPHKYLKRGGNASVLAIVRHPREMMLFNISSSITIIMIIITIL